MKLSFDEKNLNIKLGAFECIFSLHGSFSIPLENIVKAGTEKPKSKGIPIRSPGTHIPGLFKAGTFHQNKKKEFWYYRKGKNYLTIDLKNESYDRIILGIDNNQYLAEMINGYVKRLSKR